MVNEIKTFEDRKDELLKAGKKKGYVTYEQIVKLLKGLDMDNDSLDELYNLFSDENINVMSEKELTTGVEKPEDLVIEDLKVPRDVKIDDPVKMYLKEIGKMNLLTTAEEVELAKLVESGRSICQKTTKQNLNLRLVVSIAKDMWEEGCYFWI